MPFVHHRLCLDSSAPLKWGATRGQADLRDLPARLSAAGEMPSLVLDFSGIEAANDSYIRSTVLWCLRCAILARNGEQGAMSPAPWSLSPIPLAGLFLTGLTDEVRSQIDLSLRDARLPCFEVPEPNEQVHETIVLGHLDTQLRRTLDCLVQAGGSAVSEQLWSANQGDKIGLTAWNNRLSELFVRLLIERSREGKFWRYSTSTSKITYGLPVHVTQS